MAVSTGTKPAAPPAYQPAPVTTPDGQPVDADYVVRRLEEAGATLLALPGTGWTTRLRTSSLEIVRTALESYGWSEARIRPAVPSADRISRMDEAMGWIGVIPLDRYVLRRIVGARSLVQPGLRPASVLVAPARRSAGCRPQGSTALAWAGHRDDRRGVEPMMSAPNPSRSLTPAQSVTHDAGRMPAMPWIEHVLRPPLQNANRGGPSNNGLWRPRHDLTMLEGAELLVSQGVPASVNCDVMIAQNVGMFNS